MRISSLPRPRWLILALVLGVNALIFLPGVPLSGWVWLFERLQVFATIFLGIFIEAIPFLILGTLGSGLAEVFLDPARLEKLIPRRTLPATLGGALLGLLFPVCECGVVPFTRRLFRKGLPVSAGVAFLLAAPALNPVVILSTAAAFGWGWILLARMGFTLLVSVLVGLIFSQEKEGAKLLRSAELVVFQPADLAGAPGPLPGFSERLRRVMLIAVDEFFEMGRFLLLGAVLAAAMQALIPQSILLEIGTGPVTSVLVMLALAVLLSICSTVDAFVALGFVGVFSPGAILAFLVFGPMVDIKSTLMFLRVFQRKPVAYLVLLPFLMSLLIGIAVNLLLG